MDSLYFYDPVDCMEHSIYEYQHSHCADYKGDDVKEVGSDYWNHGKDKLRGFKNNSAKPRLADKELTLWRVGRGSCKKRNQEGMAAHSTLFFSLCERNFSYAGCFFGPVFSK